MVHQDVSACLSLSDSDRYRSRYRSRAIQTLPKYKHN